MPTRSLTSPSPPRTLSPSPERSSRSPSPSSYRSKSTRLLSVRTPASYTGLVSQSVGAVSRLSFFLSRASSSRSPRTARALRSERSSLSATSKTSLLLSVDMRRSPRALDSGEVASPEVASSGRASLDDHVVRRARERASEREREGKSARG